MKEQHKLTIQMAFFFLIIFVIFGTIILKEKQDILFLPKIETKLNEYLTTNYSSLNLKTSKIKSKNNKFTMKVMNPTNNNLYFYITYHNKKITDTYEKDYQEGNTLINYLNKEIEKIIKEKTNDSYKVKINNTYDNFSSKIKETLLKEEKLESLKIYTLEKELTTSWDSQTITKTISTIMTTLETENITPKNYTFIINDKNDITKSVKITNLTTKSIENNNLSIIINDIINDNKTSILSENNITYEYLN